MRSFTSDYLRRTRRGMWSDDRTALDALRLGDTSSVLDVGCGDGALTRVLADECPPSARVVGCDADVSLLRQNPVPCVRGDALALPFADDGFEVAVCQALLVNLRQPERAVSELVRVASDRVACIEPDNSGVRVESTVDAEAEVARRTRRRYIDGVPTDVGLGDDAARLLRDAGLSELSVARYDHELVLEPPYTEDNVRAVRRKATGKSLAERRDEMEGDSAALDALREDWREVGRAAAEQMRDGDYRRRDTVPFYVVVGEL